MQRDATDEEQADKVPDAINLSHRSKIRAAKVARHATNANESTSRRAMPCTCRRTDAIRMRQNNGKYKVAAPEVSKPKRPTTPIAESPHTHTHAHVACNERLLRTT